MKTIKYNDLQEYSFEQKRDFNYMLSEFRDFVKNGGDLNLDVVHKENEINTFFSWFNNTYPDHPEYFKQLIDEKLINNPFSFNINHEEKTIHDIKDYGLYFMKNHFQIFSNYIREAIVKLAKDIQTWDLGSFPVMSPDRFIRLSLETLEGNPSYVYSTYNGVEKTKYKHPLTHIILTLNDPDLVDEIFSLNEKYKDLLQSENMNKFVYSLIRQNTKMIYVLYKHGVLDNFLDNKSLHDDKDYELTESIIDKVNYNFVLHCVLEDNIKSLKKYLPKLNLQKLNFVDTPHFLENAKSEEMIKFLIEHRVHFKFDPEENKEIVQLSILEKTKDLHMFSTIVKNIPEIQDIIKKDYIKIYYALGEYQNINYFEKIKILTEQFNFPLDKIDAFNVYYNATRTTWDDYLNLKEDFLWLQTHGCDPRKCSNFMKSMIDRRGEGIKILKNLNKNNMFDPFAPDPIFHILKSAHTKDFYTFLEKAPKENFSRLTINGEPAWWSVSHNYGVDLIKKKSINYQQLSTQKYSYLYYLVKNNPKKDYNTLQYDNFLNQIFEKTKTPLSIMGKDNDGNNIFHHLYTHNEYNRNEIDYTYTKHIMNSQEDFSSLLMEKNKNNITALENVIDFLIKGNKLGSDNKSLDLTQKIIMRNIESFDFSQTIPVQNPIFRSDPNVDVEDVPLLSIFEKIITKQDDLDYMRKIYESKTLYQNLKQNMAKNDEPAQKRLKI